MPELVPDRATSGPLSPGGTLPELVDRLERAAAELRAGDIGADRAAALIDDCARLAADASAELDRGLRAAQDRGSGAGADQLALGS
jgi:hypothetical protein